MGKISSEKTKTYHTNDRPLTCSFLATTAARGRGEPLDRASLSWGGYHFKNQSRCETERVVNRTCSWGSQLMEISLNILTNDSKQQGVNESCFLQAAQWPFTYLFLSLKERNHIWSTGKRKREFFALLFYMLWTCVLRPSLIVSHVHLSGWKGNYASVRNICKMTQSN